MSLQSLASESHLQRLLESAGGGSSTGLGELLESFRASMLAMASRRIGGQLRRRMSSSDLVQDTMLAARQQFASFRGSHPREFQEWLHHLFHSRLVDGIRRHHIAERRRVDREEDISFATIAGESETPSKIASANEEATRLVHVLQELPEVYRRIIQLRYIENRSFEQIAVALKISVATAWRRFQEATELVHQSFQPGDAER